MNIQAELERLNKNVYTPMVFYFPYDVLPFIAETAVKELEEQDFFNSMCIIDSKGKVSSLSGNFQSIEIFGKSKILKSNFLQLLELEGKMKVETFSMFIEEYRNTVSSFDYIYTWMVENIARDIPKKDISYRNIFELQAMDMKQHLFEIEERFIGRSAKAKGELNFERIIEDTKSLFPVKEGSDATQDGTVKKLKSKRKKKTMLPREEEIDLWLLESVFNVDFGNKKHDNTSN